MRFSFIVVTFALALTANASKYNEPTSESYIDAARYRRSITGASVGVRSLEESIEEASLDMGALKTTVRKNRLTRKAKRDINGSEDIEEGLEPLILSLEKSTELTGLSTRPESLGSYYQSKVHGIEAIIADQM